MDNSREAPRSSSTSMAASNGGTKRRQRSSESSRGQEVVRDRSEKKERDPESMNRSKRRRSERFMRRNERDTEEDSSDESMGEDDEDAKQSYQRKSFPSSRIPRHAVADGMIGVPVPRKARSACVKRSHDCRTSSGSGGGDRRGTPTSPGFEVVSPSSSTVSVKQKKKTVNVNGSKSGIPKPPKSSGTMEDDLEIEIAEVLSGLKQQHPHRSKILEESENPLLSSDVKGADDSPEGCKASIEAEHSANIDKSTNGTTSIVPDEKEVRPETPIVLDGVLVKQSQDSLDSAASKGVLEGPQLRNNGDESNCASKLEIDLMVPPTTVPSSPERLSLLPLASDSIAAKDCCKQDSSVKGKENILVEKRESLNFDLERLSQETGRYSNLRLQNLNWIQPQKAKSAQQSSVLPLTVAVGGWPSGLPHQGYVPLIQNCKPVDGGSYTLMQGASFSTSQPRPKRCATHVFIARNIQQHQHFVKGTHLPQPNKDSVYLKGGDLRPAAGNPSLVGSPPILSLNSQAQDRFTVNVSPPKDRAFESGHFSSTRQKKPQLPPASSSIVPAQAFIFPTNHHLQPVILPSKSSRPTNNNPCVAVGTSVNFNHPSSSACEASSPYFTVLPNNAYSFQLSSTIRDGSPSQALPFFNGSLYSPQMFQPSELLQKQSKGQWETKTTSCSSSSHRQLQPQVSVNSVSSQTNVQKHRQQSQKSEARAAGDKSDSRGHTHKGGPYGQIMTAPMQPQNFSMSFASFAGGSAPANLNFSTNDYQFVPAAPVHQKNHQASDSKTGGGSCLTHVEDPKKTLTGRTPAMKGQTLVFDNPSRTLNFVAGTWPPPAVTTMSADTSVFSHHHTQRQQQSSRSKTMTQSQADSVTATSSQWKNPATSSLTLCNLKQFQSQQQIRTHGQSQISFAAPSKSKQERSGGGSSSAVIGSAPHGKAADAKASNSKALPLSPVPSSAAHPQDQAENSASGSTQKNSPVCGRNVPRIITSCPGHLSELKY